MAPFLYSTSQPIALFGLNRAKTIHFNDNDNDIDIANNISHFTRPTSHNSLKEKLCVYNANANDKGYSKAGIATCSYKCRICKKFVRKSQYHIHEGKPESTGSHSGLLRLSIDSNLP